MLRARLELLCLAILPLRIGLDLLWWVQVGGFSLPQLASVALAALLGCAWLATGGPRPSPGGSPALPALALAWWLWLGLGALRAESGLDAARYGLQLGLPLLWVQLLSRTTLPQGWPLPWTLAPLLPVSLSLIALLMGQPEQHVLHGWPRLLGAYGNLHSHAAAMAAFCATLGGLGLARREILPGLVATGAGLCLLATWVRGAWLWVLLALVLALLVSGRLRRAILLAGAAGLALLLVGALRERWADGIALLSLQPPDGGWGALGSWRIRIWSDSLSRFLSGPPAQLWLGRGLGGQMGLHRHLDPHSDWLSLLYQLGLPGLALWLGYHALLLGRLLQVRRQDLGALAFGLLCSALLVALVTNDFLFRPTPCWWTYALVGLALRSRKGEEGEAEEGKHEGKQEG